MNTPELLAPAGDATMLHAAVDAGADAVYLGMTEFNARRNAGNFDAHSLEEACDYAHLRGARIYVAMNTIILPHELEDAVSLAKLCHRKGADAFIVQDLGLMVAMQQAIPGVRIHVSTQMNTHSADGIRAAAQLGARRVTLARELSLEELQHLSTVAADVGVELEAFAHGALCICYSGQCLMSSMIGSRSANRGLCAQACRLPYELKDMRDPNRVIKTPGPHLLSPKDLCTIESVPDLVKAGIASLKIEGRMKSPEYVHTVVGVYRAALDGAVSQASKKRLESVFSRGFTEAYLRAERGNGMMSYQRPNNRGQALGRVKSVTDGVLQLSTSTQLQEGDLLEVWTSRSNVTVPVSADMRQTGKNAQVPLGEAVKNASHIHANDRVFRVRSAQAAYKDDDKQPKIPVRGTVSLQVGHPLAMEFSVCDDGTQVARRLQAALLHMPSARAEGAPIELARTKPVIEDEVCEHVDRLGQTPFRIVQLDIDLEEGVGVGFSQLHRVRTQALQALEEAILSAYDSACQGTVRKQGVAERQDGHFAQPTAQSGHGRSSMDIHEVSVAVLATNPECARAAKRAGADNVYVPALNYRRGQATCAGCLTDAPAQAGFPKHCTLVMPSIIHDPIAPAREAFLPLDVWDYVQPDQPVMVQSLAALSKALQLGAIPQIAPSLPVTNSAAVSLMDAFGVSRIWLSPELSLAQIESLLQESPDAHFGIKVAGAQELMVCEHCLLMSEGPCAQQCESCTRRRVPHALRDRKGYDFPIMTDAAGRTHLYNGVELDTTPALPELIAAGISAVLLDATLLTAEQTAQQTGHLVQAVNQALSTGAAPQKRHGTTSGHLHRGVA